MGCHITFWSNMVSSWVSMIQILNNLIKAEIGFTRKLYSKYWGPRIQLLVKSYFIVGIVGYFWASTVAWSSYYIIAVDVLLYLGFIDNHLSMLMIEKFNQVCMVCYPYLNELSSQDHMSKFSHHNWLQCS